MLDPAAGLAATVLLFTRVNSSISHSGRVNSSISARPRRKSKMAKVKHVIKDWSDVVRYHLHLLGNEDVMAGAKAFGLPGLKTMKISELMENPEKAAKLLIQLKAFAGGMRQGGGGKATFDAWLMPGGYHFQSVKVYIAKRLEIMKETYGLLEAAWAAGVAYGEETEPVRVMDEIADALLEEDAA